MPFNRRNFLRTTGGLLPLAPLLAFGADDHAVPANPGGEGDPTVHEQGPPATAVVKFFGDGDVFDPSDYIAHLQQANAATAIVKDRYGSGGVVEALEKKFADITGKEKAIYMPSGTMANQLAIAVLSGNHSKVIVQETSHVFRDEDDSAQSVFGKRLVPLAEEQPFFTADQLKQAVEGMPGKEAFVSPVGAVSIENPVRRLHGKHVPIEEIRKIGAYCKSRNIKMHLDGARIYMASAWSGTPVKEYADQFDTIYISLYKYFGAGGGAMLCGPADVISQMPHLIKTHGGNMYSNWTNAAMALYRLDGFEKRLRDAIGAWTDISAGFNAIKGLKVLPVEGGTNIFDLQLAADIDAKKMRERLDKDFRIRIIPADGSNKLPMQVNETLTYRPVDYIVNAFRKSIA